MCVGGMASEQASMHGRGGCGDARWAYVWSTYRILMRILTRILARLLVCVPRAPHTLHDSTRPSTVDRIC